MAAETLTLFLPTATACRREDVVFEDGTSEPWCGAHQGDAFDEDGHCSVHRRDAERDAARAAAGAAAVAGLRLAAARWLGTPADAIVRVTGASAEFHAAETIHGPMGGGGAGGQVGAAYDSEVFADDGARVGRAAVAVETRGGRIHSAPWDALARLALCAEGHQEPGFVEPDFAAWNGAVLFEAPPPAPPPSSAATEPAPIATAADLAAKFGGRRR